jgi:hypothetical protein
MGTLGTRFDPLSAPGSRKGGAHHRPVEVGGVMCPGGQRKGSLVMKPGAKDVKGQGG